MSLFPWPRRSFFSEEEKEHISDAIKEAERRTSGEVRVFVERRCKYVDPLDRAAEIFFSLGMEKTEQRNATLVYVATRDRQLAVFGDEGIHQKVGLAYWRNEVAQMIGNFRQRHYAEGIRQCVLDIGEALSAHFPYDRQSDKNELPDDIVFGR